MIDLQISKLSLRSTRVALLGYFERNNYKFLDQRTDIIYKSQDVIFKEGITHLALQPILFMFNDKDDLFKYRPRNGPIAKGLANEHNYNNTKSIAFPF